MVAHEDELGRDFRGTTIYPTLESLKKFHDCWEDCGIVAVNITPIEVVCLPKKR
jgi:hypothetical protein